MKAPINPDIVSDFGCWVRNCNLLCTAGMHNRCKYSAGSCIQNETKRTHRFYRKKKKKEKKTTASFNKDKMWMNVWTHDPTFSSCQATYENSFPPPWRQIIIRQNTITSWMCCMIFFFLLRTWVAVLKGVQIKRGGLGQIRSNSTLFQRPTFIFWHLPYSKVRHSPCGGGP